MSAQPIRLRTRPDEEQDARALVRLFLRARSPGTLRAYRGSLEAFAGWLGSSTVAVAIATLLGARPGRANRLAYEWRCHLVEEGYAPNTTNGRLAALRAVIQLARMHGLVSWVLEVPSVRAEPVRDTRGPTKRQVEALLSHLEDAETSAELRDRALVRLLFDLALRRGEAVSVDLADVELDEGVLLVRGKGRVGKTAMGLPRATSDALRAWITARGDEPGPLFHGLVKGRPPSRLSGTSVSRIVRELGRAVGIERLRPHGLRHAAITQALDATNGNIRAVQRFSRHRDPRTVMVYDDARDGTGRLRRIEAE